MPKNAVYSGIRQVRTYVELRHSAGVHYEAAKSEERGSYHTTMSALLFAAFTFEAYLNHVGEQVFDFWDEIDTIRVLDKYSVLCKHFKIEVDTSTRPYQTLKLLFRFRNAIAHGRSMELTEMKEIDKDSNHSEHAPKTPWEEYCTLENTERALEDLDRIVSELHEKAGLGKFPYVFGATVSTVRLKDDAT